MSEFKLLIESTAVPCYETRLIHWRIAVKQKKPFDAYTPPFTYIKMFCFSVRVVNVILA